jgi:stearoyl-CoA desaturase (delta-9 desaturase)
MRNYRWFQAAPFFAVHVAALLAFFVPFSWGMVALCLGSYVLRMFAITGGYHRYFAHRSYKTSRAGAFALAWIGSTSTQKGALWWAANHRHHHRFSDLPQDIHSPVQDGFWWSHVGWILSSEADETRWDQIQDLAKYPELVWVNKWHLVPVVTYAAAIFAIWGLPGLVWGYFLSTVLLWHGTFTINSLSHVFGSRRYATSDDSRNNPLLALITLGEGWHNNHHTYMSSANQGFFWWEYDFTYYTLTALSWVGLTRDLRKPPLQALEAKRIVRTLPKPSRANSHPGSRKVRTA